MIRVDGKYNFATIFSEEENVEQYAKDQVKMICDQKASDFYDKIVVMPDIHPGKIGPIGLVMKGINCTNLPVFPGLIGPDIGCGVLAVEIEGKIDFRKLDIVIRDCVPSGSKLRKKPSKYLLDDTQAYSNNLCLGTLGGGNHFIEVDTNGDKNILVIHSGSRSIGYTIYKKYMDAGHKLLKDKGIPYELTYLTGDLKVQYLRDVEECQYFGAHQNRLIIMREIFTNMKWKMGNVIETFHNFISYTEDGKIIIRKGAQSACKGEDVIIPVNMAEGIIIGKGKGNEDWLWSAPHGSGRLYSREMVKTLNTLNDYKKVMKGIHSPSINRDTLDECPMAYRSLEYIKEAIKDSIEITDIYEPIYNFKAGGE